MSKRLLGFDVIFQIESGWDANSGMKRPSGDCCAVVSTAGSNFFIPLGHGRPVLNSSNVACWHNPDLRLAAPEGPLTGAFRTLAMGHVLRDLVDVAEGLDVHDL
jgi:hypothetical protein